MFAREEHQPMFARHLLYLSKLANAFRVGLESATRHDGIASRSKQGGRCFIGGFTLFGWLLPVLTLFLLGGQQAHAGTNQWTGNGPYGGVIHALAIDPTKSSTVYAGGFGGGVFKSSNGGASWSAVSIGQIDPYVVALAVDPTNSSTVFAGTDGGGRVLSR